MSNLYRGTLVYDDEPLHVCRYSGKRGLYTGKRNDPECIRAWKRAWRARNREKYNSYLREYMRKRRREYDRRGQD